MHDPGLLFLSETDLLQALRKAVFHEQELGTIQTHYASDHSDFSTKVEGIEANPSNKSGRLVFIDGSTSLSSYNLIVSSEGTNSILRSKYAGHFSLSNQWKEKTDKNISDLMIQSKDWENREQNNINSVEDRNYVVLRGNAPLNDAKVDVGGTSFQTWGEGNYMRFAAVPFTTKGLVEKYVWFATINDSEKKLYNAQTTEKRKALLKESFEKWHDPISKLIESTPADEILMERAVAHKNIVKPILNFHEITEHRKQLQFNKESTSCNSTNGNDDRVDSGPIVLFAGDAAMTVDPVLAQGFTISLETSADLAKSIEKSVNLKAKTTKDVVTKNPFVLNPKHLREELKLWHERRRRRMVCLLRATDFVQSFAQPSSGSLFGLFSVYFARPAMSLTPSFLKNKLFSFVMKYSLGLYGNKSLPMIKNLPKNVRQ